MTGTVVGIDFDNTIVTYEGLLGRIAVERGWLDEAAAATKRHVRDRLLVLPGGNERWTLLQAIAYGTRIGEAPLMPGVTPFLERCRAAGIPVHVVSHKTRTAAADERIDLRRAAFGWMEARGLFDPRTGLTPEHVHFEASRTEKIERIRALGCTVYVDDLEETFADPGFPSGVDRILLGTGAALPAGVTALPDWEAVAERILGPSGEDADLGSVVAELLGLRPDRIERIPGGRNNRIYLVTVGGARYVAKRYVRHPGGDRDRLGSEYDALLFLRAAGVGDVPRPIAADRSRDVGVYEHVAGDHVRTGDVREEDVAQAIAFVDALRRAGASPGGEDLGPAAEACFSFEEVLRSVQRRLARVAAVSGGDAALASFLADELVPVLDRSAAAARERSAALGIRFDAPTPAEHRTLSPSDFGFHNSLRRPDGRLVFLDLEYFGRDDAAKMISDFLLQPVVALPADLARKALDGMCGVFDRGGLLRERVGVVRPLFALKWALIYLNEFLPERQERRRAVDPTVDLIAVRREQLAKARAAVRSVLSGPVGSSSVPDLC